MGEIVDLHPAHLEDNAEFIADLCRYAEGLLTDAAVKKKYRFTDAVWEKLGDDDALVEKIEAEKIRRMRDGSSKREKSQMLITKAPAILDGIMSDASASPRHRVDAIKTLDGFAANGPEGAPAADRFVIQINLGDHVERFNKSIEINADDRAPDDTGSSKPDGTRPRGKVIATIPDKSWDDDGEPV